MTSGFGKFVLLNSTSHLCRGAKPVAILAIGFALCCFSGCSQQRKQAIQFSPQCGPCQTISQQIEYPQLAEPEHTDGSELLAGPPMTITSFQQSVPWELTVEQCVELALANSKIMQKLGGVVVNSPVGATTLFDQALNETSGTSVESALSAFDAQLSTSLFFNRTERIFNNPVFGGGADSQNANTAAFQFEISKQTAAGTSFAVRNLTDYTRTNTPIAVNPGDFGNRFGSVYDIVNQFEVRQPLGRGSGTLVNRIAGPNAAPGVYNGVLIARVRSDISLADFEAAVRDLVRDVENNYWELYFAYRDLDTKISARESSRATWENRKLRYDNGVGRPDDEAQARQQYFTFQTQAQNALTGVLNGQPGVLGSERNLRRLLGLPTSDGRTIRPISEPSLAPVAFDWDQSQYQTLERRVELRRQKWTIRQRELELIAAKSLNKWQFDVVGQYGFRGFGDELFGNRDVVDGSAFESLLDGNLDDWQVGIELGGAIGKRRGYLTVRNAELNLVRERALLNEQQRQILHDLNAAFTEVDRAMASLKSSFNSRVAVQEELDPKRKRVNAGQDQVFFLLDAEQRAATSESAVHRAVADYNQALLNYAYTSGALLSRYNIHLTEGAWSEAARKNANRKAPRFEKRGENKCDRDTCPISSGAYPQSTPLLADSNGVVNYPESSPVVYEQTYQNTMPEGSSTRTDAENASPSSSPNPEPTVEGELKKAIDAVSPTKTPGDDVSQRKPPTLKFSIGSLSAAQYLESQSER